MWYPNWILKMCKHGPPVASYYHLDQIETSDHWFQFSSAYPTLVPPSFVTSLLQGLSAPMCLGLVFFRTLSSRSALRLLPELVYRRETRSRYSFSTHFRRVYRWEFKIYSFRNIFRINPIHSLLHCGPSFTSVPSNYFGKELCFPYVFLCGSLSH